MVLQAAGTDDKTEATEETEEEEIARCKAEVAKARAKDTAFFAAKAKADAQAKAAAKAKAGAQAKAAAKAQRELGKSAPKGVRGRSSRRSTRGGGGNRVK